MNIDGKFARLIISPVRPESGACILPPRSDNAGCGKTVHPPDLKTLLKSPTDFGHLSPRGSLWPQPAQSTCVAVLDRDGCVLRKAVPGDASAGWVLLGVDTGSVMPRSAVQNASTMDAKPALVLMRDF